MSMNIRTPLAAAMTAVVLLVATGCAVSRGQETTGAYIDDANITTQEHNGKDRRREHRPRRERCARGQERNRRAPLSAPT